MRDSAPSLIDAPPPARRPRRGYLFGLFPLCGVVVFAVLALSSSEAFDDVPLVYTAAPSVLAGVAVTAALTVGYGRRLGLPLTRALKLAAASVAVGACVAAAAYTVLVALVFITLDAA